jgi:hypothetical protein
VGLCVGVCVCVCVCVAVVLMCTMWHTRVLRLSVCMRAFCARYVLQFIVASATTPTPNQTLK